MNFKVLSYNIHKGYCHGNTRFVLENIKKMIQKSESDIVFLQEITVRDEREKSLIPNWPTTHQLAYLSETLWPFTSFGQNVASEEKDYGNAVMSRFEITKEENLNLTVSKKQKRGLLHVEVTLPNTNIKLHLLNVHLDLFEQGRLLQVEKIIQRVEKEIPSHDPIILAGDFNDWSQSISSFLHKRLDFKEAFLDIHGKHAKTFPTVRPSLSLDRIYYKNLSAISATVLKEGSWKVLSDHLPILCEFSL